MLKVNTKNLMQQNDQMAAASPNEPNRNFQKPLATLHENIAEHMASHVSIVNTIEGMQMAVEDF
jgi:hypothetical protein